MYKRLRSRLQLKLVAVVVLGVAIAFSIIGWLRIRDEASRRLADLHRSGHERVVLLAAANANLLIGFDYTNMEALAERVLGHRDVEEVVIRNAAGKVMVRRTRAENAVAAGLSFEAPIVFASETIGTASLHLSTAKLDDETVSTYAKVIVDQFAYGLTLGLLIYFAASRTIVEPITRICDQMRRIIDAEFTNVPEALHVRGDDEIAVLGRMFNDLNSQVYAAQDQLRQKVNLAQSNLMATNHELHQRTAELEKALALVERLAITDALTGLYNRRHFDDRLAADFSRARRYGEPLTLMLLDVDRFKHVNDTHGHAAGDALLQELGKIFANRCRETDIVARLGGDEFAFLLYRCDLAAGAIFAGELLRSVNAHPFAVDGGILHVGLSIGLACTFASVNTVDGLYAAADMALYAAKRNGRNDVATYPLSPSPQTP